MTNLHAVAQKTVAELIGDEIIEIMNTYDRQMSASGYVDTPGGLEHMGDVWRLLDRWRERLVADREVFGEPNFGFASNPHPPTEPVNLGTTPNTDPSPKNP